MASSAVGASGSARNVVVVGSGGHALVTIEVLRTAGFEVVGCVSADGMAAADVTAIGATMLGTTDRIADLVEQGRRHWFVAVGDNRERQKMTQVVEAAGGVLVSAASPDAVVSPSAAIAPGVLLMPGVVVNALTTVEEGAIVNTGAAIDHECTIGAFAHVAPRAALAGGVQVGAGALIGIGSAVVPRVAIGAWATVGAGAAVVTDVADGATVAGVPARVISGSEVDDPAVGSPPTERMANAEPDTARTGEPHTGRSTEVTGEAGAQRSDPAHPDRTTDGSDGTSVPVPKVLVVCTGNLCRSPLAEALLRSGLEAAGIAAEVSSAGLTAPQGQLPDQKLLRVADELGVAGPLRVHQSRGISVEQLAAADLVLAMTAEHVEQIERLIPGYDRAVALRTAAWRSRVLGGRPMRFGQWATTLAGDLPESGAAVRDTSDDIDDPMGGRLRQYRAMGAEVDELVRTLVTHWSGR